MKLRRIEVENYGLFSGQSFEFESDFTLVFGPNEAGKSTLLQLIREQLFGFQVQNPYAFASHAGEMAATAELDLSDGDQLRFRRRKGKKDVVVGELKPATHDLAQGTQPATNKIDEAGFASLLGGMTQERYQHLFGFSLEELTAGQESLNEANIGEALYGGAIGGLANFQNIRAELQDESDSVFTPRGRTKVIDGILRQLREQAKALKTQTVKPRDYEQLARECEAAAAEVGQLQKRVDELRREEARLARITSALEPWLRHQRATEELAELSVPPDFPLDGAAQLHRLKKRREEIADELQAVANDLQAETRDLQDLKLAPELIDCEAQVRQLQRQITQIESCRGDSLMLEPKSKAIKSTVATRLRELHPKWDPSQLEQFESTIAQRETIERLKREREQLDHERGVLDAEHRAIAADIASLQQQLAQIGTTDSFEDLAALLDEAPTYQRNLERLAELREQAAELDEQVKVAAAKLKAPLAASLGEQDSLFCRKPEACTLAAGEEAAGEDADASGLPLNAIVLPVPLEATVVEFRERWQQAEEDERAAQQQVSNTERELADKRTQLDRLESRSSVPDREQLLTQRNRRDAGWQMIRGQFLDDAAVGEQALRDWLGDVPATNSTELPAALARAYEQSVGAADELADERQEKYELAAKRDQLTDEIHRLQTKLASDVQLVERRQQQAAEERASWEAVWEACPFQPLSPDAMLAWLRDYEALGEVTSQYRTLNRKIDELAATVAEFESRLAASLPDEKPNAPALLSKAKQLVNASRQAAVRQQAYEEQLPKKQLALGTTGDMSADLDARHGAWQASWQKLLDEFAFPHEWDVHIAATILAGLAEARSEADKAKALDQRIADMQHEVTTFEKQVQQLCEQIAPDLCDFLAEHAINDLFDRLEHAKQSQRDHERLWGEHCQTWPQAGRSAGQARRDRRGAAAALGGSRNRLGA